jgi:hypothetical protein
MLERGGARIIVEAYDYAHTYTTIVKPWDGLINFLPRPCAYSSGVGLQLWCGRYGVGLQLWCMVYGYMV